MSAYQLPVWVWPTALFAVCAIAAWRGRDHERLAAGYYLACWAVTRMVFRNSSEETQWPVLAIDLTILVLFLWLALRSRRFWPLFAAAFQLLAVVTHLARAVDARVSGWAYLTAELVWSYLVLIAIGYASWTARSYPASATTDPGATLR